MSIITAQHHLTPLMVVEEPRRIQLLGIGTHAPRSYSQTELIEILGYAGNKVAELIIQNAAIDTRSFYKTPLDFGHEITAGDLAAYHRHYAPLLAAEALWDAAGEHVNLNNLDALITTTSTGFMAPGIAEVLYDTYRIGQPATCRYNLVGHGCSGIIPALQIAQSLVLSGQARKIAVVCTEAVAALFNPTSRNKMSLIQHLIFGEGGAALLLGDSASDTLGNGSSSFPAFLDWEQTLAPDSLDAVTIRQNIFWEGVTDKTVPELVGKVVPSVIQPLLDRHGLTVDQIPHWAFHTGGRKILEECQACLGLSDTVMQPSFDVLLQHGNMLSASAPFTLHRLLQTRTTQPGDMGMLVALGPGITAGAFLMRWDY